MPVTEPGEIPSRSAMADVPTGSVAAGELVDGLEVILHGGCRHAGRYPAMTRRKPAATGSGPTEVKAISDWTGSAPAAEIGAGIVRTCCAATSEALMYDRIIVPVEEGADVELLERPRLLARALNCPLTLLHVHRPREAPSELEGLTQYRYQHVVESVGWQDSEAEAREAEWLADLADAVAGQDPELDVTSRVVHAPLSRCVHGEDEKVLVVASGRRPRVGRS
jgi:nucleotide-binding universal stress UspA family protein